MIMFKVLPYINVIFLIFSQIIQLLQEEHKIMVNVERVRTIQTYCQACWDDEQCQSTLVDVYDP